MWLSHFRSWEMVVSRNLNDSTAVTVLSVMVIGWSAGGFLLKSTSSPLIWVFAPSCYDCTRQQLNLLPVSRLVSVLDEADDRGVVRKLQELDRGVFRCAVIGVEGEEQWGENTALRGASADGESTGLSSLINCCLSVRKLVIHWQMEVGTDCVSLSVRRRSGMMVLKAELKSTNKILA